MTSAAPAKRRKQALPFGQECTLEDIAKAWGLSRARIDQLERRAFEKMREAIKQFAAEEGVAPDEWLFGK